MVEMQPSLFPVLLLGLALPLACRDPDPAPPPREAPPPGFPDGTFFWRIARGDRDRIEDYREIKAHVLAVVEEAASFPGPVGEAASPAAQLLPAVREAFDESRRPGELEARLAYFDRTEPPAAEGIAIVLVRRALEKTRALRLTIEDLATGGAVDGQIDRVRIVWSPRGEHSRAAELVIELGNEGGQIVQHVAVASGAEETETHYRVTAPQVSALFARVEREVYKPLSGAAFLRLARAGPLAMRPRPAPPQGTSFPAPEVH